MIEPQENATSAAVLFKVPGCRLQPLEIWDHRVDRFLFRAMFRARRSPLTRRGPMKALLKGTLPYVRRHFLHTIDCYADRVQALMITMAL
jgi:hypothetical protein